MATAADQNCRSVLASSMALAATAAEPSQYSAQPAISTTRDAGSTKHASTRPAVMVLSNRAGTSSRTGWSLATAATMPIPGQKPVVTLARTSMPPPSAGRSDADVDSIPSAKSANFGDVTSCGTRGDTASMASAIDRASMRRSPAQSAGTSSKSRYCAGFSPTAIANDSESRVRVTLIRRRESTVRRSSQCSISSASDSLSKQGLTAARSIASAKSRPRSGTGDACAYAVHVRYSATALIAAIVFGTGCNEAIYTLGRLPADSDKRNSCRDSGAVSADGGECNSSSANATGGRSGFSTGGTSGSGGIVTKSGGASGSAHGGGDSGVAPSDAAKPCADDSRPAVRRGLNLYMLVDDSLSVVLQPAWNSLTLAISAFVDDPNNTGLGLGIGYYGISCTGADYSVPAVRVAPLPDVASAIKGSYPLPISGKAITPAIDGALAYARVVAQSETDRDTSLVLVTDGIVDPLCGSTQANAAQALASGVAGTPSVRTHVIALGAGPTLLDPANIIDPAPLDALAAAGGTQQAMRIEVNLSTNDELTAALNQVVVLAAPCAYEIPTDIDASKATLEWEDGATSEVTAWPRVTDANACGQELGAFVRPAAPQRLELCQTSCNVVRSTAPGRVLVKTGCP